MDSPVLIFNPPAHAVPDIIEDLSDPDLSMKDIAHEHQTTFAALVAWMARPDIRSQIRDFRSSSIERCKLIADNYLPIILKTCVRLINEYNDDESNRLYHPSNWNKPEQQRRNREAARKTLYLMLRLHSLQLDEPVVHSDPSRKRTRYQPIEASQDRDRGLESIAINPQTLPISAVPSPRTPEPISSAAPIADSTQATAPPPWARPVPSDQPVLRTSESSSRPAPIAEHAPVSSSPSITPSSPSAASESPSESSVDLPPSSPEGRTTVAGGRGGAAERGPAERSQPPVCAPSSSSLSSDSRPSEGGPLDHSEPYSTDDLLTELAEDHPELAHAATAVKALLKRSPVPLVGESSSRPVPSDQPTSPPAPAPAVAPSRDDRWHEEPDFRPRRISNIVDHLLRTFSDDPDEAIERAKQRDHETAKQELTNSS